MTNPSFRWLAAGLRLFLAISMPVFLVLTSVRLVATETFVKFEYHRPGFPDDRFGFTREDRLTYAPYALRYLRNDADISYLGNLEFDGEPLYTPKELQHMEDVKVVARAAFRLHTVLSLAWVAAVIALAWRPETRRFLRRGLAEGGFFTIALIITLVVLILANWDFFFDGFHSVFFKGDSWQFSTSSTLIRLFPEQFWFDAAMGIGLLTVGGALLAMAAASYWERQIAKQNGAAHGPVNQSEK
jgi:integral membrane protein (TIGR01906 family)